MGFIEAVKICFSKYATFQGRARRSEYWYFYLFIALISLVLGLWMCFSIYELAMNYYDSGGDPGDMEAFKKKFMPLLLTRPAVIVYLIIYLATLLPSIAAQVRRLHDSSRTGWWALLPWIGSIFGAFGNPLLMIVSVAFTLWFYVLLCLDSTPGTNKYGPNPKGIETTAPTEI